MKECRLLKSTYKVVQRIFAKTLDWNARRDPFVMWGTCQGFQMMCRLAASNFSAVESGFVGMDRIMMSMNATTYTRQSRMLGPHCPN